MVDLIFSTGVDLLLRTGVGLLLRTGVGLLLRTGVGLLLSTGDGLLLNPGVDLLHNTVLKLICLFLLNKLSMTEPCIMNSPGLIEEGFLWEKQGESEKIVLLLEQGKSDRN